MMSEMLILSIKNQEGEVTAFRTNHEQNVHQVYSKKGVPVSSLCFLYDGNIIDNDATVAVLGLKHRDIIDVV